MSEKAVNVIEINKSWCKNCLICMEFCPRNVFITNEKGIVEAAYPEKCSLCGICQLRCPDFAITLEGKQDE